MKKDALLKTNLFICVIIVLGFAVASYVSYHSNNGIFKKDVEHTPSPQRASITRSTPFSPSPSTSP